LIERKGEKIMSKKATNDALRLNYVEKIMAMLAESGEDVLRVNSNEVAIPVVDGEGEDNYVVFTVKVPTGSRDGDAYDAYGLAQEYEMKCKDKAEKAKKAAEVKARKISRDEEMRRHKAEQKAKREG
jgi:UDP-3-O-acyl-N-acetylglucosamine deacetylase